MWGEGDAVIYAEVRRGDGERSPGHLIFRLLPKPGQNTRYPLPIPELPKPGPELPESEVPDPKFGYQF